MLLVIKLVELEVILLYNIELLSSGGGQDYGLTKVA